MARGSEYISEEGTLYLTTKLIGRITHSELYLASSAQVIRGTKKTLPIFGLMLERSRQNRKV